MDKVCSRTSYVERDARTQFNARPTRSGVRVWNPTMINPESLEKSRKPHGQRSSVSALAVYCHSALHSAERWHSLSGQDRLAPRQIHKHEENPCPKLDSSRSRVRLCLVPTCTHSSARRSRSFIYPSARFLRWSSVHPRRLKTSSAPVGQKLTEGSGQQFMSKCPARGASAPKRRQGGAGLHRCCFANPCHSATHPCAEDRSTGGGLYDIVLSVTHHCSYRESNSRRTSEVTLAYAKSNPGTDLGYRGTAAAAYRTCLCFRGAGSTSSRTVQMFRPA